MIPSEDAVAGGLAGGIRWLTVGGLITRGISTLRGLLLARLLGPVPFGAFVALTSLSNIAALISEFGLATYVTHHGSRARDKARESFLLAVCAGVASGAAFVFVVLVVPGLTPERPLGAVVALAGIICWSPLVAVSQALLRIELRFRALATCQMVAELGGIVVAILLIASGRRDLWVLVATLIASQVIVGIAVALMSGWPRHGNVGMRGAIGEAARFGAPLTVGAFLWAVALQGDNVVVGKILHQRALGIYGVAYNYGALPATLLASGVGQVALPAFTRARESGGDLSSEFVRFSRLLSNIVAPVVVIAVFAAGDAVDVLLGPRWQGAVVPLRVFLVAAGIRTVFPTDELLRAIGRVKVELAIGTFAAPAVLVSAFVGAQVSIDAVAFLVGAVFAISAVVAMAVVARTLSLRLRQFVFLPIPSAGIAAAGCGAGHAIAAWSGLSALSATLVIVSFGLVALWAGTRARVVPSVRRQLAELDRARSGGISPLALGDG